MSKSLHNFYTVDDIEAKGFTPVALRYALTSGAYRQTINFTMDSLHAAQSALVRLKKFSDETLTAACLKRVALLKAINKDKHSKDSWGPLAKAWKTLSTDLNIPGALGAIFTTIKETKTAELSTEAAQELAIAYHKLVYALGYDLTQVVNREGPRSRLLKKSKPSLNNAGTPSKPKTGPKQTNSETSSHQKAGRSSTAKTASNSNCYKRAPGISILPNGFSAAKSHMVAADLRAATFVVAAER